MAITDFGKAIRKARIDADVTLSSMADALSTTPSFLSALEMGRKRIPEAWVEKIDAFFRARNIIFDSPSLHELAAVANKSVSLDGMSPAQQMLVAGFARVNLNETDIAKLAELLTVTKKKEKRSD